MVTKILLKTRSGEFDLESIHSLNLKDLGNYIFTVVEYYQCLCILFIQ